MARRKVKLEFISNRQARKVSFKKRKVGLLKKLEELTTLCGVMACAIIFSNFDEQPEIWPSPSEAFLVIEKFKKLPTRKQATKYMMDQATFLEGNISKVSMKLDKLKNRNQMLEIELMLENFVVGKDLLDFNYFENLSEKIHLMDAMIGFVTDKIEHAKTENEIDKIEHAETKNEEK